MPSDDLQQQLIKYLEDVHSTEQSAITQLRDGADSAEDQSWLPRFVSTSSRPKSTSV